MTINVEYLDGTVEHFQETSRPGGSYHTACKTELGWLTITDAYGSKTIIPSDRIKKVITSENRY